MGGKEDRRFVEDSGWPSLRSLAVSASVLTLAQVALGAGFRHRAFGIMPHIIGAIIVAMFLLIVATFVIVQFPKHAALSKGAWALIASPPLQIGLGVLAYIVRLNHWESAQPGFWLRLQ